MRPKNQYQKKVENPSTSDLDIALSRQYTILHPIATRLTPHNPVALKSACDAILLLLQYHEPRLSHRLSDLRLDVTKAFSPLLSSLFSSSNSKGLGSYYVTKITYIL